MHALTHVCTCLHTQTVRTDRCMRDLRIKTCGQTDMCVETCVQADMCAQTHVYTSRCVLIVITVDLILNQAICGWACIQT